MTAVIATLTVVTVLKSVMERWGVEVIVNSAESRCLACTSRATAARHFAEKMKENAQNGMVHYLSVIHAVQELLTTRRMTIEMLIIVIPMMATLTMKMIHVHMMMAMSRFLWRRLLA